MGAGLEGFSSDWSIKGSDVIFQKVRSSDVELVGREGRLETSRGARRKGKFQHRKAQEAVADPEVRLDGAAGHGARGSSS